jgi:hypothetical protein
MMPISLSDTLPLKRLKQADKIGSADEALRRPQNRHLPPAGRNCRTLRAQCDRIREPRPGIPPSPQHTVELIGQMKRDGVKIIVVEPYFDLKTPNSVAAQTGGQVVVLTPSVGGEKEITDYFKLFDYDIAKLKQAFDATH